ncbi:MAG: TetR/AcrR family transcriptional regulator [Tannerella sp.]|jgi:AcrR family transcriptional regulator|nr:TetR/AcrR family transcriptional regulator [Tannerella sp.]
MLKEQIITTAKLLFYKNGIKKVSMNDIAEEAGVSKRTLYESFDNKEALLATILETMNLQTLAYLNELDTDNHTALDIILLFNQKLQINSIYCCDAFYDDMLRYPGAMTLLNANKKAMLDSVRSLLARGVKEGIFLPEIDYDLIVLLAREYVKMSPPSEVFKRYTHEEVRNTFFLLFIRGICTDEGRKILRQYLIRGYYDILTQRSFRPNLNIKKNS